MSRTQCPVCYGPLEVRDVSACWQCGHSPLSIERAFEPTNRFAEVEAFGQRLVLCRLCILEFPLIDPTLFCLPPKSDLKQSLKFIRLVDAQLDKDKFCPSCQYRLAFLNFIARVRADAENQQRFSN